MKNLIKNISRFVWMFIACVIFSSCSEDEKLVDEMVEGLPVSISFDITTPAPGQVTTRATDEQETNVEKLALFFYKDNASLPVVYEVPQAELASHTGTGTNYKYNVTVPESAGVTSGTWFVYAVANWDKGFWDDTMTLTQLSAMTKAEMDKFCILKKYRTLDITETAILLSGKYGDTTGELTLKAGANTLILPIHLKRSIAKITFNFSNGDGVSFTPRTFEVHNYCRTSTLFERDGFDGGDPGTLEWAGCAATSGEQIFSEGTGMPVDKGSIMFYMPENVQKAKNTIDNQLMREKKTAGGKNFENASDKATYIVVHGDYVGPISQTNQTKVTADVHYTILLGDFSKADPTTGDKGGNVNNYTTRRNTKYTYNVKVNGVNNIYVEATKKVENQPGAEGNILKESTVLWPIVLDAHYETRILKISLDLVQKKGNYGIILKTPYSNYVTKEITTGDLAKQDLGWVEFCKPATITTWVKYPGKGSESLMTLPQLLRKFHSIDENNSTTYENNFIVQQEADGKYYVYVQVFVNEYFYEGRPLSDFINYKDRELTISSSTDISNDGNSTYTGDPIFAISQKSIKTPFNMASSNPFGLETFEDDAVAVPLNNSMKDSGTQNDMDNGHQNYFASFTDRKWSTYVDYTTNKLKPEYNYGVYQGLLRNRDLNNDDYIDDNEMKWFIPSVNQHIAIWNGFHALEKEVELDNGFLYYTSTNGQYRTMWAKEGAFGAYKTTDHGGNELVRCIRALKDISAKTSRSSNYDAKTRTFNVVNFDNAAIRPSGSQKGEYLYHSQNDNANKLPEAFQMAKGDLTVGGTPGNPGDSYLPNVRYSQVSKDDVHETVVGTKRVTRNLSLSISNIKEGCKYYYGKSADISSATEISNPSEFNASVIFNNIVFEGGNVDLYIISDNGNYRRLYFDDASTIKEETVVIEKNKPTAGTTGSKSEFTLDEVTNQNICADYYENPDGSDKGQWRVPNQRELMLMLLFSQNGGMAGSDYKLSQKTATRTYYDERGNTVEDSKKAGMFFIQVDVQKRNGNDVIVDDAQGGMGKFITSQNDKGITKFKIRPVRDVAPQTKPAAYNSAYEAGGDIIK